jgi:hypothetical protein
VSVFWPRLGFPFQEDQGILRPFVVIQDQKDTNTAEIATRPPYGMWSIRRDSLTFETSCFLKRPAVLATPGGYYSVALPSKRSNASHSHTRTGARACVWVYVCIVLSPRSSRFAPVAVLLFAVCPSTAQARRRIDCVGGRGGVARARAGARSVKKVHLRLFHPDLGFGRLCPPNKQRR